MRRMQKWAALILTVAMVVTSVQMPVYGATEEDAVVTEITSDEAQPTAEEAQPTADETQPEVTAIEEETPVGYDETVYVRRAAELVSALNGYDVDGTELPTNQKVRIQMEDASAGYDFKLTAELLGGRNLTVKEGLDVTLDMQDMTLRVSDNAVAYDIEVPKNTRLNIISNKSLIRTGIVNYGTLSVYNTQIREKRGDGIVNHEGATADLETAGVTSSSMNSVAVRNAGTMTIGNDSYVYTEGNSHVAVENTGELQVNFASIAGDMSAVSSCGIKNTGAKAQLSIRGSKPGNLLSIEAAAYGVFNDAGTVTIGKLASDALATTIESDSDCAILTVNGGTVVGYEGMDVNGAVATSRFAGNEVFKGATDGQFKMLGGQVSKVVYGDNKPILIGGTVGDTSNTSVSALEILVSENKVETDLSKYTYLNKEDGTPVAGTYTKDGKTQVAYAIVDGKVYQPADVTDPKRTINVTNEEELRAAVVSGGNIKFQNDISLSQNLVIAKDTDIDLNGGVLSQTVSSGAVTVNAGAEVSIQSGIIEFTKMAAGASAITNNGTLLLQAVQGDLGAEGSADGAAFLTNNGSLDLHNSNSRVAIYIDNATGIHNTASGIVNASVGFMQGYAEKVIVVQNEGTFTMNGGEITGVYDDSGKNSTAVYNSGKFIMNGEIVKAQSAAFNEGINFAIVYTDNHYPVLCGGAVIGASNYRTVSADNFVLGSAVVKEESKGNYSRGFFQIFNSEEASVVDGQNSYDIESGDPRIGLTADALGSNLYLLLEKGDVIDDVQSAFKIEQKGTKGEYKLSITSSDPAVASVTAPGENEVNWTLSANQAGYTILKAELTLNDKEKVEDYLRIEVTDKKADLTEDDYTGSLLGNLLQVNSYFASYYTVPFEVHLNTSDMEAATGKSIADTRADSFYASDIIIDDEEFNKYFTSAINYYPTTKMYGFLVRLKMNASDTSTKLLEDGVKSIQDIKVTAKVHNKATGKDIKVPLGSFAIRVDAGKPVVKAVGGYTLNSAFNMNEEYEDDESDSYYPNWESTSDIKELISAEVNGNKKVSIQTCAIKACSDGISEYDDGITANVKKGNEFIRTEVTLSGYKGTYLVDVPVTVINKYPKVSLNTKSVTVSKKSSAETDIPLYLYAKDMESAGTVQSVEIVTAKGKSSNYTVKGTGFGTAIWNPVTKQYQAGRAFYLQPKSILNKAETVTLKVNYDNTNAKNGKPYSTTVSVKMKPTSKFTIKQAGKASLCTTEGSRTTAFIKTTPENFRGAKLVVTGLNGKSAPEEVADKTVYSPVLGEYGVDVTATENTKSLGKKLQFGIAWVDENGKQLEGTKVAKMTVSLYADTSKIVKDTLEITVKPEKLYKKMVYRDNGDVSAEETNKTKIVYTAPVKIQGNGAWSMASYSDTMFDIAYSPATKKVNLKAGSGVIGGTSYKIPLTFTNKNTKEEKVVTLTVKVADVKKVQANFGEDTIDLYQAAPYVIDHLTTAVGDRYMSAPMLGAGLTGITKVEIVDANSPFEIYESEYFVTGNQKGALAYKQKRDYGITFKDKKCPKNISGKRFKTVTLKITYTNGIKADYKTATVKMKVNIIPDPAKK